VKIHLVDGTYELFRAYFGPPSARFKDREVGATRGFLRSLLSLLANDDVSHVAVAFDTRIESFRNDLFDGYKTGEGMDPDLFSQFPLAEQAARAAGVTVWSMIDFEADDAIATGAARYKEDSRVEQVLLCSPDKDLCQCVDGDRVVLFDRMRDKILDDKAVEEKFGVPPAAIPDYLGLVGDSADGIPGIPRWGAKSAAALLAHYGSLEAIPDDETEWVVNVRGAKALAENLRERRSDAELYKVLATLRVDVPLDEKVDDLEWKGADRDALLALIEEIGDSRVLDRVPRFSS